MVNSKYFSQNDFQYINRKMSFSATTIKKNQHHRRDIATAISSTDQPVQNLSFLMKSTGLPKKDVGSIAGWDEEAAMAHDLECDGKEDDDHRDTKKKGDITAPSVDTTSPPELIRKSSFFDKQQSHQDKDFAEEPLDPVRLPFGNEMRQPLPESRPSSSSSSHSGIIDWDKLPQRED
jgi:hypothetical protein